MDAQTATNRGNIYVEGKPRASSPPFAAMPSSREFPDANEVYLPLFAYLEPRDLMRLSRVSRHFHQAVSAYIEDAFAIEPRLAIFFPDAL